MRRKGVVKTRHREVRSAERVVDSEGRTGRSGDRVVDSESQICRQNVVVTPRAEQAEVPTSMACLVLVKIKGPDNPTCVFFRKSVAVDTIGSLSKGTSECASVSQ